MPIVNFEDYLLPETDALHEEFMMEDATAGMHFEDDFWGDEDQAWEAVALSQSLAA